MAEYTFLQRFDYICQTAHPYLNSDICKHRVPLLHGSYLQAVRNSMERNKVLVMCSVLLFFMPTLSKQDNVITITQYQSIKDDQTLVSAAETFEAGFFSLGSSKRHYFGIWYKSISPRTIVWVANRDNPVENSTAILKLTDQGNILIIDGSKCIVWSSNASRIAKKPFMQLLDSGNLVVKDADNGENLLWESFDYPGDTLLPGMKIKSNLVTGPFSSLTSWKNTEDPGVGEFTNIIETHHYPQLVIAKGTKPKFRGGPWIGNSFDVAAKLRLLKILNFSILLTSQEISYQYETWDSSVITRLVLNPAGLAQRWIWSSESRGWEIVSSHPSDQCEYYALCGPNSNCDTATYPVCECLEGFIPKFQAKWNSLDNSGGCVRMKNLSCENNSDGFLRYAGVKLPDTASSRFDPSGSLDECMALCLQHCSCTAYAYLDGRNGCLSWFGDIWDMRKTDQGQDIYIRVDASELDRKRNFNTKTLAGSLVIIIIFIVGITTLVLATCKYVKKERKIEEPGITKIIQWKDNMGGEDIDLATIFDFPTISNATNQFSPSNKIGEGGFGQVYKGLLYDGQEIAVKRLFNTSEQGIVELKNEVMLVAKLQHRNLVKLIGCSIHQDEKLLIYEFVHNRSLDYFIFDPTQSKLIDWNKRFQIIDGIARGLLYLHQDSRLRIIHRDLKTSNILLDKEMNAKISDFGLARTFKVDQVEAKTKRVMGTYGYMSPEYVLHGSFSIKSDVFSFGVIVLEIISGRKNRGFCDPHHHLNLLSLAWRLWIEERPLELTDDPPNDSVISTEIMRYIHVGLLCVQQRPGKRPNMSSVVLMLNSEKVPPNPSRPAFYTGQDDPISGDCSSGNCERCSRYEVSVSLEAR